MRMWDLRLAKRVVIKTYSNYTKGDRMRRKKYKINFVIFRGYTYFIVGKNRVLHEALVQRGAVRGNRQKRYTTCTSAQNRYS